ncbi:hypothetical protein GF325_09085 [Candidatus Bathyarchaeota archaeon]|nr:hypothetical protein [Candidatus Bathyarchaeota archaeon]
MKNRYHRIILLLYAIAIPSWLFILAAVMEFDIGFKFGMRDVFGLKNEVFNFVFYAIAAGVLLVIGTLLFKKYRSNHKPAALLLSTYNFLLAIASGYESMRKFILFHDRFDAAREVLTFIVMSCAIIYFFLFMQEIFTGSFKFDDHRKTHAIFFSAIIIGDIFLALWPFVFTGKEAASFDISELPKYIGFGFIGVTIIVLCLWQVRAAFLLVKKSDNTRVQTGLKMMGLSAIAHLSIIASIIIKEELVIFDAILPILVFTASILTYMGYVYPSRKE